MCGFGSPGFQASAAAAISLRRARYAGSFAPGWSCARWTVTDPSAPAVTGEYSWASSNTAGSSLRVLGLGGEHLSGMVASLLGLTGHFAYDFGRMTPETGQIDQLDVRLIE